MRINHIFLSLYNLPLFSQAKKIYYTNKIRKSYCCHYQTINYNIIEKLSYPIIYFSLTTKWVYNFLEIIIIIIIINLLEKSDKGEQWRWTTKKNEEGK